MYLLDPSEYSKALPALNKITFNHFFARSVVERKVAGKVYVDDVADPKTFYVVHPYGMSLLFGESGNWKFNERFLDYGLNTEGLRDKLEWMQATSNWDEMLRNLFGDRMVKSSDNKPDAETGVIELNTRINFRFDESLFKSRPQDKLRSGIKVVRSEKKVFDDMKGSVVPSLFWNSAEEFFESGIGFSVFHDRQLASTAYSAFILGSNLEIGIETVAEFRGKGLAELACAALIEYCVENDFTPVWACRLENVGSYKLAQKVGFVPCLEIPYYRLGM